MKNNDAIVYACAGCSGAGHIAYKLALSIDKKGIAEMSCLAGIASERKSFKREIRNRKVMVIDGCPLECGKLVFEKQKIPVDNHIRLDKFGVEKQEPVSEEIVQKLTREIFETHEGPFKYPNIE